MRHRLVATTTATLVLALAVFTGTSLAGNGNGSGGNSQSGQPSHPAQSNKPAPAPSAPTTNDNSTGVKPSSSTNKDPGHDTHAAASSNKTKQYGNGKTAGQIATQAGQPGSTILHGPGNSQPHKTTTCGHSHEVDVHALKSAAGKCGSAVSAAVKHAQKTLHAHPAPPAKHETPAAPSTPAAPATPSMAHVTICHATGSATNPYVRISPSVAGVYNGHLGHQDGRDIVPPFTYNGQSVAGENWDTNGQAIYNNGCAQPLL
jgi:hypothetical protein